MTVFVPAITPLVASAHGHHVTEHPSTGAPIHPTGSNDKRIDNTPRHRPYYIGMGW